MIYNKKDTNLINKAMNIVLLILFLSSIALVIIKYSYSGNLFLSIGSMDISLDSKLLSQYIVPNKVILTFSKDSVTFLQDYGEDILENSSTALREAFLDDKNLEQISLKGYNDSLKRRNITLVYGGIPSKIIEKAVSLTDTPLSTISDVLSITFTLDLPSESSIYIKTIDNTYKIDKDIPNRFSQIDAIEKIDFVSYYPIFPDGSKDDILIPINPTYKKTDYDIKSIFKDSSVDSIAYAVFGDKLDFTSYSRRSDGSYLYSYKNGQEIMKIDEAGFLEYKNDSMKLKNSITTYDAVLMGIRFLDKIGMSDSNISISSVEEYHQGSNQIVDIKLKKTIGKTPFVMSTYKSEESISIVNGIISQCNINLGYAIPHEDGEYLPLLNPLKSLELKYEYVTTSLDIPEPSQILGLIEDIDMVYYQDESGIYPAWLYKIGGKEFLIDGASGRQVEYGHI